MTFTKPVERAVRQIRLHVAPPYRDETLSSFLDRAGQTYCVRRADFLAQLLGRGVSTGRSCDFDETPDNELYPALLGALELSKEKMPRNIFSIPADSLRPSVRGSYCPRCFQADLQARRTPYFRWQWAVTFVTLCPKHGTPLYLWRRIQNGERLLPRSWLIDPTQESSKDCGWLEADAEHARLAGIEAENPDAPIHLVAKFQSRAYSLKKNQYRVQSEQNRFSWWEAEQLIKQGAERVSSQCREPLASRNRPCSISKDLFGALPGNDIPRQAINTFRGIRAQRCPAWRRTVVWFAAKQIFQEACE